MSQKIKIIEKFQKVVKWFVSSDETQDPSKSLYNQRALKSYQEKINKLKEQNKLLELNVEQEAIIYAKAYYSQLLKNPSSAKFPSDDEFSVSIEDKIYLVTGYCDATNSYGAPVRENIKLKLIKEGDVWMCIDKHTSILNIYIYFCVAIFIISILTIFLFY